MNICIRRAQTKMRTKRATQHDNKMAALSTQKGSVVTRFQYRFKLFMGDLMVFVLSQFNNQSYK